MNKKRLFLRYFFWSLTALVMVFLFIFSSQAKQESANLSSGITEKILKVVYKDFESMPTETRMNIISIFHVIIRKMAHFTAFFFMGLFSSVAMRTYNAKLKIKVSVPLIIGFLYAVFDEVHQAFVPGRGPGFLDVLLDFSGCLCGTACAFLIFMLYERRKNNE